MERKNIYVIGNDYVGKSTMVIQTITGQFHEELDPTIEDYYNKQMIIDNKTELLEIRDFAGGEGLEYRKKEIKDTDGFVIVYSITNESSFQSISILYQIIKDIKELEIKEERKEVVFMLIGNKIDLENERKVSTTRGIDLAHTLNIKFKEISAKCNKDQCDEVFIDLVRDIRSIRAELSSPSK